MSSTNSNKSGWYQITCQIPQEMADQMADFLADLSGNGVCTENRSVDSFSTAEIPQLVTASISAYFALPCQLDEILTVIQTYNSDLGLTDTAEPLVTRIDTEDWANSWKQNFKPLQVGQKLMIVPTWEATVTGDDRHEIRLDPGMAFGTGGHETTRLCLEALELILEDSRLPLKQLKILDLGTGSGILAIAAAKLGARQIDALDIDQQAVEVARENCILNNVSQQISCSNTPLEQLDGNYNVILANILAEELVRLAPQLSQLLASEGSLILSGILTEREELVLKGFAPCPLTHIATTAAGEWCCIHYKRQP